ALMPATRAKDRGAIQRQVSQSMQEVST
ncbi:MAG: hypothetical protein QOI63_2086, partial [Thermoplasmata archaeon]|nr:hypothetical protein [Thermoplasmata archaeon]